MSNAKRGADGVKPIKLTAGSIRRALQEGVEVWAYPMPKDSKPQMVRDVKTERLETGSLIYVFSVASAAWFVPRKVETRLPV